MIARRPARAAVTVAVAVVATLLVAGCGSGHTPSAGPPATAAAGSAAGGSAPGGALGTSGPGVAGSATRPPTLPPVAGSGPTLPADDRYAAAVDAAARHGLSVWIETDLAKRWLAGRDEFDRTLSRVVALARRPGVVGIKIADELGYDDGFAGRPDRMRAFLADSARALRPATGRLLLIDLVVPELGCAPGLAAVAARREVCRSAALRRHPGLDVAAVGRLLADRDVDAVDLSTGLLDESTYRLWGIDREQAQRAAWAEVSRLGWPRLARLSARKALAHPDRYGDDPARADADLRTFVDIPREAGSSSVDIWTWRQRYQGQTVRLMDPGLAVNPLWNALLTRRAAGANLVTHFSPSSVEVSVGVDLTRLATVFRGVFVAAGTG